MPLYNGIDCFTKANLRNAMDVGQSKCSGLSLFSRGRCQVVLKSTQCVTPSLTFFFFLFQYNFIEHAHVQITFTKDNLQQNEKYNLKLTKKKPDTIKTLVVTKIKWERNQLSKQNFIPYLKETKKQTILF